MKSNFSHRGPSKQFYADHLMNTILPFWMSRAVDAKRGGIFTCFDNSGTHLISRDKYTWSQGRYVWMMARLADLGKRGLIQRTGDPWLEMAAMTVDFLAEHVFLEDGHCAFVMDEHGNPKISDGQTRLDVSIYADCFVALGFLEYARVTGDNQRLDQAWQLYHDVVRRIHSGDYLTEPYPVPDAITVHGLPMILLNLTLEFYDAFSRVNDPRATRAEADVRVYIQDIWRQVDVARGVILEHIPKKVETADQWTSRLLCRHIAPGHTAETLWLIMHAARALDDPELLQRCTSILKQTFRLAWDEEHGGLLRFVDMDGGIPSGALVCIPYEAQILETWDMKLWWVHSEFLYAAHVADALTGDDDCARIAQKVHDYTFSTFPNPDRSVGEWLQKRDRLGQPQDKVVALPVKDPYHAVRNLVLSIELFG